MHRLLWRTAVGLCLAPLVGLGLAHGSELTGTTARGARPPAPAVNTLLPPKAGCGSFGTSVRFVSTPGAAAARAKKAEKLVFVLHVSGNFEDPRFT